MILALLTSLILAPTTTVYESPYLDSVEDCWLEVNTCTMEWDLDTCKQAKKIKETVFKYWPIITIMTLLLKFEPHNLYH